MQHAFIRLCDRVEWFFSRWYGATAYAATMLLAFYNWEVVDRWVYISNALLVVLLIGNSRRSDKAMHKKLDEVDPKAGHNKIEQLDEREIEESD